MSDDGRHALTIIALIGSVFSPYYARSVSQGTGDPLEHCSMNVALYGPRADAWSLTERGARDVARARRSIAIGPSSMEWDGEGLRIAFDEVTSPVPSRLRGVVRVRPSDIVEHPVALDAAGRHTWSPIAPCARAEVTLSYPSLRFTGSAYVDSNAGAEPLERAFSSWTWSRSSRPEQTAVTYHVKRADGTRMDLARSFEAGGGVRELPSLAERSLGRTRWGMDRSIPVDPGTSPRLLRTLEDTPFYARSLASASFAGQPATVVHEALSLERFKKEWVRFLLPFRMRRAI